MASNQTNGMNNIPSAQVGATAIMATARPDARNVSDTVGEAPQLDPEVVAKIAEVRAHVREAFGKAVMVMTMLQRYRNQTLGDLHHLVLEPLLRDRIAIACPGSGETVATGMAGLAIWASVSDEVDARIRDQISAGPYPIRLKPEDWNSGDTNWLLDVIAPDQRTTASVIANFKQGRLRLHPLFTRLVDADRLKKMGAGKMSKAPSSMPAATILEAETIN